MPIVREPLDPKVSMWYFLAFYLRFWREKTGLSLTQCGEIMGVTRGTVSNFEAGRRRLQDDHVERWTDTSGQDCYFSFCSGLPEWPTILTGESSSSNMSRRRP
ncbi:helix-turn-helix domain-containing protein [Actinomadura welshii]|uniref:helix-turn-helix domain-containing protein n=1 Tax=Actinomadura welshii TaxID=3103817 RepID=UPI003B8A5FB8